MPAGRPDPVSHEAIMLRLEAGDRKFDDIHKALEEIKAAVGPIPTMQADVAATKEIVAAWGAVKTLGNLITATGKLVAAIGIMVGMTWALMKFVILQALKG